VLLSTPKRETPRGGSRLRKWQIAGAILAGVVLLASSAGASSRPVRIGVILKGLDNPFFVAMYEGARAEVSRRHVSASFRAATNSNDTAGQSGRARALVRQGRNDCYVVNPITPTNLVPAFRGVNRPVVNLDSPIDPAAARRAGIRVRAFVGTDDHAVGELAAKEMRSKLANRGEVALVAGFADSVNSQRRLSGFTKGVAGTHIRIVARVIADYDRAEAQRAARKVLRQHPNVTGFFAANDLMALGIADAAQAAGKGGAVRIIGVDAIPPALDAVRAGVLTGTVAQYPYVMGRMGIEACIAAARGKALPSRVKTPIALVTKKTVVHVSAAFPLPPQRYDDPFATLIRNGG
jgi:ABC-type sugar transport system substrate-binding protein